jgi:hypothetical protein
MLDNQRVEVLNDAASGAHPYPTSSGSDDFKHPLEQRIEGVWQKSAEYEQRIDRLRQDSRFSQKYIDQQAQTLKAKKVDTITDELTYLWGSYEDGQWAGGAIPDELERLRGEVEQQRQAAIEGDEIDQTKLANHIASVPSRLKALHSIQGVKRFYNDADPYTKRAMQMVGAEHLRQFEREVGYGSFVANLKADYEANFITPELEQAQDTLSSFEMVVISKGAGVISFHGTIKLCRSCCSIQTTQAYGRIAR